MFICFKKVLAGERKVLAGDSFVVVVMISFFLCVFVVVILTSAT